MGASEGRAQVNPDCRTSQKASQEARVQVWSMLFIKGYVRSPKKINCFLHKIADLDSLVIREVLRVLQLQKLCMKCYVLRKRAMSRNNVL
jgi:hypothetical protein